LSWEELGKTQVKIDPSQNDVQLSGSILGYDPVSGEAKPVKVIQDNEGNWVIATADAAPWAYDAALGRIKTQPSKGLVERILVASKTYSEIGGYNTIVVDIPYDTVGKYKEIEFFIKNTLKTDAAEREIRIFVGDDTDSWSGIILSDGTITTYDSNGACHKVPNIRWGALSWFPPKTNDGKVAVEAAPYKNLIYRKGTGTHMRIYIRNSTVAADSGEFKMYLIGLLN